MMKKIIIVLLIVLILLSVLFLNGCGEMSIKDIHENQDDLIGKEIITSGTVVRSTKIMTFAAFLIEDETGQNSMWVRVAPDSILPEEGMRMRVKGILIKEVLGYHIWATEVKQI